ncbi:MAG TPA: Asp-tRNA(Asn)/Glu-tRNA(Gln) amidotransferase subunit GatB, partial [Candidatus Saccharimonadales bacterium]|nr:Asp-tRNA(Asn)/Glu-tRNA(Gln) amidotransferase subunit GatB [Candidatus Saccharimonadales bacterium]
AGASYSLVDLNRAGTPLIEVVSEPDMHSPAEAKAYAQELYLLMTYADVTFGNLYHGNMRFDVNISVTKKGVTTLGTRAEIKNLNSFRSVEKAAEYEFKRQIELLEKGQRIVQETRGWDDAKQRTFSQRSKEDAMDYRYFPDADIPPVHVTPEQIESTKATMPLLPPQIRSQLVARGIPAVDVSTLMLFPVLLHQVLSNSEPAQDKELKQLSDLLINVIPGEFDKHEDIDRTDPTVMKYPDNSLKLIRMVNDGIISSTSAKDILRAHWTDLTEPMELAKAMNVIQMTDTSAIEAIVDEVLADPASQKAIADIKAGNDKVIGFLVGSVMKKSKGQANPGLASQLIKQKIG